MRYLFLVILLAGCVATEPQPDYMVRLGNENTWTCGGYIIDSQHIVTAAHCQNIQRVQLPDGSAMPVEALVSWPDIDTALYALAEPVEMDTYATLRAIDTGAIAYAFGYSPIWRPGAARFAQYVTTEIEPLHCHNFHVAGAYISNGDSGGIIEQDGKVVGMIAQFRGAALGTLNGRTVAFSVCAVPGEVIAARIAEWRAKQ